MCSHQSGQGQPLRKQGLPTISGRVGVEARGCGGGSISPGSPQPRHTTVAPVVVNELCAAPISHAQVVYLRGNELLFQALFLAPACRIAALCARDYRRVHRVNNELRLCGGTPLLPQLTAKMCVVGGWEGGGGFCVCLLVQQTDGDVVPSQEPQSSNS